MKTPVPPDDPLLADILGEAAPPGFRAALLDSTLRHARRRRLRRARPALALVAALLLTSPLLVTRPPATLHPPLARASAPLAARPCEIVRTRPQTTDLVSSRPLIADPYFASVARPALAVVHTSPELGRVRLIDDAELLALAAPRPAVLVREGSGRQRLVFADALPPP